MKNFASKLILIFTIFCVQPVFAYSLVERFKNWWNNTSLASTKLSLTNKAADAGSWAQTHLQAVPTKYKVGAAIASAGALGIWYWSRQRKNTPTSKKIKTFTRTNSN